MTNGPRLGRVMEAVWGEPACGMDYLFLRAGAPGSATGLHYDFPFFTRTTPRMYTVWIPIGPVPVVEGPLMVVEGSRDFDDILEHLRGFDIARDDTRKAEVSHDPVAFARESAAAASSPPTSRPATSSSSTCSRCTARSTISRRPGGCASRATSATSRPRDPLDPRYFGPDPGGTFGGGYGELNGAKPLDEPWHRR